MNAPIAIPTGGRINLSDLSLEELGDLMEAWGEKRFHAKQIVAWIHRKGVDRFEEMTNLGKGLRARLAATAHTGVLSAERIERSEDGTMKFLFRLSDGRTIESVFIPEARRNTLCISTQVGCAMGCTFCATALVRPVRNLSAGEIVGQVLAVQRAIPPEVSISNLVLMGMGEPLRNYENVKKAVGILTCPFGLSFSGRRITLSTVGLVPEIARMGREMPINLAVSLHAADDETRSAIMPINRKYPLRELMRTLRAYPLPPRQRITFEYVLLSGVNDRPEDAHRLARLIRGIRAKVNLIPMNEHPGSIHRRPPPGRVEAFREILQSYHLTVTLRATRGDDIAAACGQLQGAPPSSPSVRVAER